MVYVLAKDGRPLMPTERHGKARRMLKSGEAVVVRRCPFTIQLTRESGDRTQPVTLGVDAGSKHVGLSATTKEKALFEADLELRNDIAGLLSTRRQNRRARRGRKTRYRKPRFNNRRRKDGRLAPSVRSKVDAHLTAVRRTCGILPVSKIVAEVASFDIQRIKNPDIEGAEYQRGEQMGFWNVREYVLFRDNHTCQCCKGKSKDKILNVHHIVSRKVGGDAPNNLVTLCETCHTGHHKGEVKLPETIKRGKPFRDAAFMGVMRWAFNDELKEAYSPKGVEARLTYGYVTKNARIENGLPKEHYVDARCISGNPAARPPGEVFYMRKVRCHNRQIHKMTVQKGGARKRNQAPYEVKGFRLYDKVRYKGQEGFVFGRRLDGRFAVRKLDGAKINEQISYKKLALLEMRKNIITERRTPLPIGASPDVPAAV